MDFSAENAKQRLAHFEFGKLFIEELGWDRHSANLSVAVSGATFNLKAVAEKRGMVAWVCPIPSDQQLPDRATRKKVGAQIAKTTLEHLIIFNESKRTEQIWCWTKREAGKPASATEHFWHATSGNRGFLQKLQRLFVSFDEEGTITLPGVLDKARSAFDIERVTKRFYDQFKAEHGVFLDFISGITDVADREWYASLMLNRLMFIYFMQRKGFLNGEHDYLRNRLVRSQQEKGRGRFYSFYRYFLLRLFHEGLGGQARNAELEKLLGRIPYLNGGLFEIHPIEERCSNINIPDEAFERIFAYFGRYQWHLDERPLRKDDEINPDVLGYIFEKYINQKQMGAYYTKEDITEYISKNTVIPFLFDAAKAKCKVAFENPGGPTIWDHLGDDPDRYILIAIKHGAEHALPPEIATGIADVSARTQWNRTAPAHFGLPTEIWREVVARRARYTEVRAKLVAGQVREINDLITLNLDIRQFAQDVIERCEGPDLLRAFWKAIEGVTVLDPTCGSGAFLFAALNILEPLYETCLDRMEAFVADLERSTEGHAPKRFEDFKATLAKVGAHPNARYFTLKSVILNNLFGVDIMEEAVEICKLRLFLKLAAQVDPDQKHDNLGIEPLPDIDFNIRAGNTLVGYATYADVRKALTSKLDLDNSVEVIAKHAADLQQTFAAFRARQIEGDGSVPSDHKQALRDRLKTLDDKLNLHLAAEYNVKLSNKTALNRWLKSHRPFHWFIEYHGIMERGGFDVIIGNPPYVELAKIDSYSLLPESYKTLSCGNIYTAVCERSYGLHKQGGRFGMIVPISCVSTERMLPLRQLWARGQISTHASYYSGDAHPSVLFNGVKFRLAILLQEIGSTRSNYFSTLFQRWFANAREVLFSTIEYSKSDENLTRASLKPKIGSSRHANILSKFMLQQQTLGTFFRTNTAHEVFSHRIVAHFVKAMNFIPHFESERDGAKKSEDYKIFGANSAMEMHALSAVLNSTCFYLWFVTYSDVYHCGRDIISNFPLNLPAFAKSYGKQLRAANISLMTSLRSNSVRRRIRYKKTGLVEYDEFYPKLSKREIDDIDVILARYYDLTPADLDFIVNYDIKFRLGRETEEEGDE